MSYALISRIMEEHFQPNISRKISRIFSLDRKKILIYKRVYCLWLIILIPACPEKRNWSLEEHQEWPKLYLTLAERDYVQKQTKRAELIRDFKQRPRKGLVRWPEVFFKFAKLIERFSFEYRKTKTKVITLANHKGHRQNSEPIKTRSNYM